LFYNTHIILELEFAMPDLISLICPSCGGKLQVSPKATSLTCQHCGNEHLVKHEAGGVTLEAYARCPQCGRNDKSEKVTAVIGSQSQEISGMEQKNEVIIDGQGKQQVVTHAMPFTRKQISVLGQRLAPPEEPQFEPGLQSQGFIPSGGGSSGGGILAIICGAVLLTVSVIIGLIVLVGIYNLFTSSGNQIQDTAMMAIIGLVSGLLSFLVGTAAIALGIYLVIRSGRNKRSQLAEYQHKVEDEIAERQRVQSAWKSAMERWNLLYYCGRDDCVFIPGETTSAPISKMKEYLYQ
jgi:predicted RNA-binding Zn-ribbon protein involved in translation (DUF1610 family)